MLEYCPTCEVLVGQSHLKECDYDYCWMHGHYMSRYTPEEQNQHNCESGVFSGYLLGTAEAVTRNWWVTPGTGSGESTRCTPWETEDADPDVERVFAELQWCPVQEVFHEPSADYDKNREKYFSHLHYSENG
jgi:hypothetical protein